jgi:hypothetical protein
MTPYRVAEKTDPPRREDECPDAELLPVFLVAWIGSIGCVAGAIARPEPFGTEPTLALVTLGLLPYLAKDAARWWWRRRLDRKP